MSLPSPDPFSVPACRGVWRADELGAADAQVLASGHAALDAQLPGGGWPVGAMTELLQPAPQAQVWQLLLPVLARAVAARGGPVVLIGAPHEPFGPALAAGGLSPEALLRVECATSPVARAAGAGRGRAAQVVGAQASHLWACEQALRCAEVAAVLAWLPQARVSELRRLQLAAAQHQGLLFVFRPEALASSASPARLRLQLAVADAGQMEVRILKRRGPPLATPLVLPARSEQLSALLAASQWRRRRRLPPMGEAGAPPAVMRIDARAGGRHALDRPAMAA